MTTLNTSKQLFLTAEKKSIYLGNKNYLHVTALWSEYSITDVLNEIKRYHGLLDLKLNLPTKNKEIKQQYLYQNVTFVDWEILHEDKDDAKFLVKLIFELPTSVINSLEVEPFIYSDKYNMDDLLGNHLYTGRMPIPENIVLIHKDGSFAGNKKDWKRNVKFKILFRAKKDSKFFSLILKDEKENVILEMPVESKEEYDIPILAFNHAIEKLTELYKEFNLYYPHGEIDKDWTKGYFILPCQIN